MERMGLVSQMEAELERMISLDRLPADGRLPSEQKLARHYGVSRGTVREALLRLSTRGLVVQHPGRRTRAVALDEAVSLESLSVAFHGEGRAHPERWRLLEGYFALKREMTVELLATCCERASEADLKQLSDACFALGDAARWGEERGGWVRQEFALLRLAARAADRPGHLLLIQSLERAFGGMAGWVLPHLDAEAVYAWAQCAMHALDEKNAQGLRHELPRLLTACDERLLGRLAPANHTPGICEALHATAVPPHDEPSVPEAARGEVADAVAPNPSGCRTGLRQASPTEGSQSEPPAAHFGCEPGRAAPEVGRPPDDEEKGGAPRQPSTSLLPGLVSCGEPLPTAGERLAWEQVPPHPYKGLG